MLELEVVPDRYDGRSMIRFVDAANVQNSGEEPCIEAPWGDDDEFAICFKVPQDEVDEQLLQGARSLLWNLGSIDNMVQQSCAAECRASGLHPRNFESALAYIKIARRYALLHYFGTGVNTEWAELVELKDDKWTHVGVATRERLALVA